MRYSAAFTARETGKMGSTDLFSEKFAMYFSTMNPLASKIYADIEGIEDYIKAHGPPSITYNEKCSIVDKFLIHDHLSKNDSNGKYNRKLSEFQKYNLHKSEISLNSLLDDSKYNGAISEAELLQPVFYNDSILDQDHESVLLASVAPKKPEKYVYDDNNYWIDEHSGTYSSCTPTQAKACKLQQFLDSLPPPPNLNKRGHDHPQKYRAPPIPTFCSSKPKSDLAEGEDSLSSYIVKPAKAKQDEDDDHSRYSRIDKKDSEKCKPKYSVAVPVLGGLFGDTPPPGLSQKKDSSKSGEVENSEQDLPNQVQNKDLIAELQAKLKKGKNPSESLGEGISPRSSTKV